MSPSAAGGEGLVIGVDVGGTFTDVVVLDPRTNTLSRRKVSTTSASPSEGVMRGVQESLGQPDQEVGRFLHGTTIATNALIERRGARTALLVTAGLRGVVQVQSQLRRGVSPYDLRAGRTPPLVAERDIFEVAERLDHTGEVVEDLDEKGLRLIAATLAEQGIGSVAVCFLFSFLNPDHEHRARRIITEVHPAARVLCSCDVLPRVREWPRCSTIILSAYLEPVVVEYVDKLQAGLPEVGVGSRRAFIMESNGGVMPFEGVISAGRSVHTLLSGPAAAVRAAQQLAGVTGRSNLVTVDIGGTSCDIAFVQDGEALEVTSGEVSGYDLYVPMLDIATVGAGGGTIARVAPDGRLLVGPDSAGADPGPVAYGRGGTYPTATDADVVLGYLGAGALLGGEVRLDAQAARRAVSTWVGEPLGLELEDAALAIRRINDAHMADAMRVVAARRGVSLAESTMVACGGAGPLHGALIAEELGIRQVLVPPLPGVFSALGLLCTDICQDYVQSVLEDLDSETAGDLAEGFRRLEQRALAEMAAEGFAPQRVGFIHEVDARYRGQGFEIRVPVPAPHSPDVCTALRRSFHDAHQRLYGHVAETEPVELVSYRVRAVVPMPKYLPPEVAGGDDAVLPQPGRRTLVFAGGRVEATIWRRSDLGPGASIPGPAVVEQEDTTVLVPPDWTATTDPYGDLVLTREAAHKTLQL